MPFYMPFIPLLIWLGAVSAALSATNVLLPGLADWKKVFIDNLIFSSGATIGIVVTVFLVRSSFADGIKGFGISVRTIPGDFGIALVNLTSIWPIIILTMMLTILIGQSALGTRFKMPQHEELELITTHHQLSVRLMIVITAIVAVPIFEEMLFRGLFQTLIRSFLIKPWRSIAASSIIFAMAHPTPAHWPALFVLSLCLGYSYEKSGSLFRPIFIHSLFNGLSILAALYQ